MTFTPTGTIIALLVESPLDLRDEVAAALYLLACHMRAADVEEALASGVILQALSLRKCWGTA